MNTLFLIAMVFETVFGIGFIFAPDLLLGPMGVTLNESATTLARLFGSAIISFPFMLYFARKSSNEKFKQNVIKSMFVYYMVSTILLIITQLKGQMNAMGWSVVGLHIIFTFWFGRFLLKSESKLLMNKIKYLGVILLLLGCSAIQVKNDDEWFIASKELHSSGEVLCVPPYGTMDVEGSCGKVTLKKSNTIDLFIFRVVSEGLVPIKNYTVCLMQGEKPWESQGCNYGPWQRIGAFTTNEHGGGLFQIRITDNSISIIPGFISVWINDTETHATILVSSSFKIIFNLK